MLITRKFGFLIPEKATPFQLVSESILGMLIAFAPVFQQTPGLIISWSLSLRNLSADEFASKLKSDAQPPISD
ncbi:MAG: hypothetical protein HN457_02560 [Opitutales bacterium]|nr:hypothetical protein [Opitutales bacterium]MBT6380330.1 hypothetical protein [Opitutales bacterium]